MVAAGGALIGAADPAWASTVDCNGQPRTAAPDVGAHETNNALINPGWAVGPSFKTTPAGPPTPTPAPNPALTQRTYLPLLRR